MVRRRPCRGTVMPGWFRSAIKTAERFKFAFLATLIFWDLLFKGQGLALVGDTSVDLGARTWGWQANVHVAAKVCGAVFEPNPVWNRPAGTVQVYYNYTDFRAASGTVDRTGHCSFDPLGRTLHIYCPRGSQVVVVANPKLAASVFNLRGFTAWTTGAGPYQVYGYYCSSSGCYGNSDGSVVLDGTATPDSFQTEVKVYCVK